MIRGFLNHLFLLAATLLLLLTLGLPTPGKSFGDDRYGRYFERHRFFEYVEDSIKGDTAKLRNKIRQLPLWMRDRYGDPYSNRRSQSPFLLKSPFKTDAIVNDSLNQYRISERSGGFDYRTPSQLPADRFRQLEWDRRRRSGWQSFSEGEQKDKVLGSKQDGKKRVIPLIEMPPLLDRLFGGNTVDIQPNGQVMLDFGGLWQRVDNPNIPIRNQRIGGFNFDQQIRMNLRGKIGEKLQITTNFDTKNTFQFEQRYNFAYTAFDEDIIQKIQVGNISFPVSNSLIRGAQNLFGVGASLRFGKLFINAALSNSRGTAEQITIRNGAQNRQFEIRGDNYEVNRHFFLAHFFRDNYERSLRTIPLVTSNVLVTRVEVWVTNRTVATQNTRNLVAFQDLAEGAPFRNANPQIVPAQPGVASNEANRLYENLRNDPSIRDPNAAADRIANAYQLIKGADYDLLTTARRLEEREFTFHPQLGYVSLLTPLRNDEMIAVAFEYTFNGQRYKVGELTEDYQSLGGGQNIILKMLRPNTIRTDLPMWDLMMKNIYSLQTTQLQRDNFQLRVIYRDDLTGIDNPTLQEGQNLRNQQLVQVMGLDRLNPNNDPQPDGNMDFIEGVIVDSRNGRIIFPVLEPFGKTLQERFTNDELALANKYVFSELYRGTQADALLNVTKNKFFIKGSFQSGTGNEIALPGLNISPNSVVIFAGGSRLSEGTDYTVDYQMGRVRILNQGVMNSGKEIRIQYERADMFNFQTRNLVGLDLEYRLSKDVRFTGTLLYMNERPLISRVTVGTEPVRNTLWGFGAEYRGKSRFLTKMVDAIPGVSTKAESTVALKGEFAMLQPSNPRGLNVAGDQGAAYIDDFETAEVPFDLTRNPNTWSLGTTPPLILNQNPVGTEPLAYNFRRARMAWYTVDNVFYFSGGGGRSRPSNLSDDEMNNHYVRLIPFNEVFPNRQRTQILQPEPSLDLAYYPTERGPFNYTPDLTPEGRLRNPERNFGAISRAFTHDIDFDNINIQYIEFWMMDPFKQGAFGQVEGQNNNTGGQLFINLGNISEDLVPDRRHFFENGLSANANANAETPWGRVPTQPYLNNAFENTPGARQRQDIGFDGLSDDQEREKFANYINSLPGLTADARAALIADPSADNFLYYLGDDLDGADAGVLERYKRFNGTERNSPESAGASVAIPAGSTFPDNEDLNRDNTISDVEGFYQYRLDLRPGMRVGDKYIVSKVTGRNERNDPVDWYQVRIPIRDLTAERIGNINGFKSIRFIRLFMTNWRQPVVLRMVQFQLVGAQWRPFTGNLQQPGLVPYPEPYDPNFTVSTVNIEENGRFDGENTPYTLPPGFNRDFDVTSPVTRQINEQSLKLCVEGLRDQDARAVYKNVVNDFINYRRMKLEIHAESRTARSGELAAFVRLGTDFRDNYYEVEVPLDLSPIPSFDAEAVWPRTNQIDVAFDELVQAKAERNRAQANLAIPYTIQIRQYRISVVGNPDLSSVQTVMLGIRNPKSPDAAPRDACVWMNELRVTDFDRRAGWATNLSANAQLADFATVTANLRHSTVGFGSIQDKVSQRQRTYNTDFDISSNIQLDKIFLNRLGISLPLYVGWQQSTIDPFFNPLDPDMPMSVKLATLEGSAQDDFARKVRTINSTRSINLTNVRKVKRRKDAKSHLWDIENLSLNASFSENFQRNSVTDHRIQQQWRGGAAYTYSSQAKPFEPFKNIKGMKSKYWAPIKDFNLNFMPASINIRGDLDRRYTKTQLRNAQLSTDGILPQFEKAFVFNRNYSVNWNFTKSLRGDYQATTLAMIDEPAGEINQFARDSIMTNLRRLGRMKNFNQTTTLNYTVPIDKLPATDWLGAELRYQAGVTWTAGAIGLADSLGHLLRNQQQRSVTGKVDMNKLYNKFAFFRRITAQPSGRVVPSGPGGPGPGASAAPPRRINPNDDPLEIRKKDLKKKLEKIELRIKRIDEKRMKADSAAKAAFAPPPMPDFGASDGKKDKDEQQNQPAPPAPKNPRKKADQAADSTALAALAVQDSSLIKRKMKQETRRDEINERIKQIEAEQARRTEPKASFDLLKGIGNVLLSLKTLNVTVTENNSTTLPGFMRTPEKLGMDGTWDAPGWDFILGGQDPNIRFRAAQNGWLSRSAILNNPFEQQRSQEINIRANLKPSPDLVVDLEISRRRGSTYSEMFRYTPAANDFVSQTPRRQGSYSISFITIQTAFGRARDDAFNQFAQNRITIAERLNEERQASLDVPDTLRYRLNSQDVLIPSFLAAYTGRGAGSTELTAFPRIPLPNWTITYNGLTKIPGIRERFKAFTLTHKYSSTYQVGSYTSNLQYGIAQIGPQVNEFSLDFAQADRLGQLVPLFVLNQVTISENFAPLIGVNLRTNNDWNIKFDYKSGRNVGLNLANAQITEVRTSDITIDVGYTKTGLKLPIRVNGQQRVLQNELTFRIAFSIRDTRTIQNRLDADPLITAGNSNLQFRPTLSYAVNQRTTLQLYFDRGINNPLVSNAFRRTTTAFGFQVRFNLAQ